MIVLHFRSLALVTGVWCLVANPVVQAQQQIAPTDADIELWVAAVNQLQLEKQLRGRAIVNETLTAAEFRDRLSAVTREPVLVNRLLPRNQSSFPIISNLN